MDLRTPHKFRKAHEFGQAVDGAKADNRQLGEVVQRAEKSNWDRPEDHQPAVNSKLARVGKERSALRRTW